MKDRLASDKTWHLLSAHEAWITHRFTTWARRDPPWRTHLYASNWAVDPTWGSWSARQGWPTALQPTRSPSARKERKEQRVERTGCGDHGWWAFLISPPRSGLTLTPALMSADRTVSRPTPRRFPTSANESPWGVRRMAACSCSPSTVRYLRCTPFRSRISDTVLRLTPQMGTFWLVLGEILPVQRSSRSSQDLHRGPRPVRPRHRSNGETRRTVAGDLYKST